MKVSADEVNGIISCKNGSAVPFLQKIYTFVTFSETSLATQSRRPSKTKLENSPERIQAKHIQPSHVAQHQWDAYSEPKEETPYYQKQNGNQYYSGNVTPQKYYEHYDQDDFLKSPAVGHVKSYQESFYPRDNSSPQHGGYVHQDFHQYDSYREDHHRSDFVQANYASGQYGNSRILSPTSDPKFRALHDVRHEKLNVISPRHNQNFNEYFSRNFDGEVFVSSP